ncbi:kinase-like protein [Clavulina sp. PMI_390]|nr:kinase-like protein [Clavulina sp. PMI_390]
MLQVEHRVAIDFGGEAIIYRANLDGQAVIVRDTRPPEDQDWTSTEGVKTISAIRREIISQIQIHHRNVLPILGIASSDTHPLSIITPLAANGNALRYLSNKDAPQRVGPLLQIIRDIASALEYLHGLLPPIVHGDLHGKNVLIDAEGHALLCDFGLSRIKHEITRSATNIQEGGKLRYLAPEVLQLLDTNQSFRTTPASDCYAFAMTILELATLQKPFSEYKNEWAASNMAKLGVRPQRPAQEKFGALSDQTVDRLWALLTDMWAHDVAGRPSMQHVLIRASELSQI